MKYFIISGEPSGDQHISTIIEQIKHKDPNAQFEGFGGQNMHNSGVKIHRTLKYLSFMGFTEVLKNIFTVFRNFQIAKRCILGFHPDVVIFVDYPGFNLKMSRWCKLHGYKTAYYISPQVWAWKPKRIETIKKYIDLMLCILPFEIDFYAKRNIKAYYVGHPLVDKIEHYSVAVEKENKPTIALFPGSRKQEIEKHLPILLAVTSFFKDYKIQIAGAENIGDDFYNKICGTKIELERNNHYTLLANAKAAIIASGTATLEAALLNTSAIVIFKTNWINYWLAKQFILVKNIALPNIIADKIIYKEFIQSDCNAINLKNELYKLLQNQNETQISNQIKDILVNPHPIIDAAELIYQLAKNDNIANL